MDSATRAQVLASLDAANWAGADVPDTLYRRGLLLTPRVLAEIRYEALQFLVREAERWTPTEFLRRSKRRLEQATPEDMYYAILGWMKEHAEAARGES